MAKVKKTVKLKEPLEFQNCVEALDGRESLKIAPHTFLEQQGDEINVFLYETRIIILRNSGGKNLYFLYARGRRTTTTMDRMTRFTPAKVFRKRGEWWLYQVGDPCVLVLFYDGICVDSKGKVLYPEN